MKGFKKTYNGKKMRALWEQHPVPDSQTHWWQMQQMSCGFAYMFAISANFESIINSNSNEAVTNSTGTQMHVSNGEVVKWPMVWCHTEKH